MTKTAEATPHTRGNWRPFLRHFLEMLVAMVVGMLALDPLWMVSFDALGWSGVLAGTEMSALVMATNMTIGMSAWMLIRKHGWVSIAQMGAAMYVPFLVLFVPYWLGLVSGDTVMIGGHVLMLPAMVGAMLLRREEYSGHHHGRSA